MRIAICSIAPIACGTSQDEQSSSLAEQHLAMLGATIQAPPEARVEERNGCTVLTDRPSTRTPYTLELCPAPQGPAGTFPQRQTLYTSGATLEYRLHRNAGGSGGTELSLQGEVDLCGQRISVSCHQQGEFPAEPRAPFCLDWLQTVRCSP